MLGFMLLEGEGGQEQEARARELFDKACELNVLDSCTSYALLLIEGIGGGPDVEKGMAILQERCAQGSGEACVGLGDVYKEGVHVERQLSLAGDYYEKACKVRDPDGCEARGILILDMLEWNVLELSTQTVGEFMDAFEKACNLGSGSSCHTVGDLLVWGESDFIPYKPKKARKLLEKGCKLGCPLACTALGRWYLVIGKEGDVPSARPAFEKACDLGDGQGCFWLGQMWQKGKLGPPDPGKADALFEKACDLGYAQACTALGKAAQESAGPPELTEAAPAGN
jgi:TPR repeat protein